MDGVREIGRSARALGREAGGDIIPIARARRTAPRLVDDTAATEGVRWIKLVDVARLEARFDRRDWKVLPSEERRATWSRLLAEGRVRVGGGAICFDKLPTRVKRLAKLRLFRSFKLLGPLKREPLASLALDVAPSMPSVSERLRAIGRALRL